MSTALWDREMFIVTQRIVNNVQCTMYIVHRILYVDKVYIDGSYELLFFASAFDEEESRAHTTVD